MTHSRLYSHHVSILSVLLRSASCEVRSPYAESERITTQLRKYLLWILWKYIPTMFQLTLQVVQRLVFHKK